MVKNVVVGRMNGIPKNLLFAFKDQLTGVGNAMGLLSLEYSNVVVVFDVNYAVNFIGCFPDFPSYYEHV